MSRKVHLSALAALCFALTACGGGEGGGSTGTVVIDAPQPSPTPTPVPAPVVVAPPAPAPVPSLSASTAAELETLVQGARGGEVIRLAPGRYDRVSLRWLRFDVPITITSANPGARAQLTGANLRGSRGVTLNDIVLVDESPDTLYDFLIQDAEDITFDKLLITSVEGGEAYQSGPLMIRSSRNVTVTRSEIRHVRYGISLLDNQGVAITENYFHDIRTDGVRGGGNSDVEILDNLFTNFSPSAGDHPDAIQFWTTNTTASASNIRIADNVIVRGDGTPMQGIFMRDEASTLPYQGVAIERNVVMGTMYHGISVGNAAAVNLRDNRVAGMADMKSWISVPAAATLSSNSAQVFLVGGVNMSTLSGNAIIPASSDSGAVLALAWLAKHSG
jgi:hypothetical protein